MGVEEMWVLIALNTVLGLSYSYYDIRRVENLQKTLKILDNNKVVNDNLH